MGGVGKTTIMRNIHNDLSEQIKSKHFDCFIWITVSNDVDVNKLQRKIAKELKIDMEEDDDEDGAARRIFNALKRRKKFLLILDDMWDAFNLDEVGIPIPSEENDNHGDAIGVKMHDLVRDMAINITKAEKPRSVIDAGGQLQEFSIEFPEDVVRISLMDNDIEVLSGEPNCQHLLTLFLQESPLQKISPDSYFNHMCSLRVLNLSSTKINSLPESVSYLKNLRALILNRCRDLEEVPSLEKLEELRVLDLSGTKIRELPSGVEAMIYLQRHHLDDTGELRVFPAGITPRLSHLEVLTMRGSRWKWSSKTGEGAGIEEILNSTRLAILYIQFEELSDFLQHAKSNKWHTKKRFVLSVGTSYLPLPTDESYCVEICSYDLIGEENPLLLPDTTQWLVIMNCQMSSLWHFTHLLNKSELYRFDIIDCKNMKYFMAEEEPLLSDIKKLGIIYMSELLVLCKGIPSPDALKSLESLRVFYCKKLKYLLPARLLQQLRCLKTEC
ncbi:disease resistance-like protein [Cinnamomum micranthum f. kanehirae]|uniref:Disease resistance-like protein n=1 Tax=Cinnamomum micranthum f. kanehirae TaxID=337451 RepID=A0A443PBA9_9MAGN|nr:disease resistance-like protein [Cinnamomum micranthum f. kanehirae]